MQGRFDNKDDNLSTKVRESSWLWSYGNCKSNYICEQCPSPLKMWVQTLFMVRCTQCNIMWSRLSV